jgi:hypothetical protein
MTRKKLMMRCMKAINLLVDRDLWDIEKNMWGRPATGI